MNVLQEVVKKGWCIGCGMCAAICTKDRLAMHWNDRGEYNPVEVYECVDCPEKCSLCYQVCPAHGRTKNESEIGRQWYGDVQGIQHTDETGYYLSAYVGYSKKHRATAASGGMATWTLETLLETREVDTIIAVGRTNDPAKLFEFKICKTAAAIRRCSRSAYYPVEISQVVKHILQNDGSYAIIGLPCVCKAIRLAQNKFTKLKQRIKYVLGLTCGHQCSKFFAEYICGFAGGDPHQLKEIVFRAEKKERNIPAPNLAFNIRTGEGINETASQVLWLDGINFAYVNGYFQVPGCFYCDDIFAECGDGVFMDAWLPEYAKQSQGNSLFLIREARLNKYFQDNIGEDLTIVRLPAEKIIQSQQVVVAQKRRLTSNLIGSPELRLSLQKRPFIMQSQIFDVRIRMAQISAQHWILTNKDFNLFTNNMRGLRKRLQSYQKLQKLLRVPIAVHERLKCIL